MSRQICRDFQRGNCRFGTRCKFSHQLSQQQPQSQRNSFDSDRKKQGGIGLNANPFGALSDTNTSQRQQQQHQPAKDHKCNNPKVCQDQIKEDFKTEQPTYWRLTSYGHWKFLPCDISGDVSPEELRALAYDSAKQGVSLQHVIQNERSLIAAKNAEFEAFSRKPYQSPGAQSSTGFSKGTFSSSPFLSSPQPIISTTFGVPKPSTPTEAFGQPTTLFGVPIASAPQSSGGFATGFNKTGPVQGASPFPATGFGQNGFGSQAKVSESIFGTPNSTPLGNQSNVSQSIFSTQNSTPLGNQSKFSQSIFGTQNSSPLWNQSKVSQSIFGTQNNTPFGNRNDSSGGTFGAPGSGFGTPSPFTHSGSNTMSSGFENSAQSPFLNLKASQPTSQPTSVTSLIPNSLFTSQALPGVAPSLDTAHKSAPTLDVWKKDAWKLGEEMHLHLKQFEYAKGAYGFLRRNLQLNYDNNGPTVFWLNLRYSSPPTMYTGGVVYASRTSSAGHLSQKLETKKLEPSGKLGKKPFEDEEQDLFMTQASTKSKNMTEATREPPSKLGRSYLARMESHLSDIDTSLLVPWATPWSKSRFVAY